MPWVKKNEGSLHSEKVLRALKFLQIASTIEQFKDLERMLLEEAIRHLKAHEEWIYGHVEDNSNQLLIIWEELKARS